MSREDLGRAAHQAMVHYFNGKSLILTKDDYTWEGLDEETRELYRCEADGVLEALKQELAQKILDIIREATERANKVSETFAHDNMDGALDAIEALCKEQQLEEPTQPLHFLSLRGPRSELINLPEGTQIYPTVYLDGKKMSKEQ
jgi:hypothetical protein